jgi:hypothetical protein
LLQSFAGTGLKLTITKEATATVIADQQNVVTGPAAYVPTPDITLGRLGTVLSAWLMLDNVTYPLEVITRPEFFGSYRYNPLAGLPLYLVILPETETTTLRLYPAPSQAYELHVRGKFELAELTSNDTMAAVPNYYLRPLQFALAKDLSFYKGRSEAWTDKLESVYRECIDDMITNSEVNVSIMKDTPSQLNGANRVRAGI